MAIKRYSRPEAEHVWSDKNKYSIWLDIEYYATEAMSEIGLVSIDDLRKIKENMSFDVERIDEIEKETKHDVIAFLTNLSENIGYSARFIHKGMTSSDLLDTALSVQIKQAGELILSGIDALMMELKRLSYEYKDLMSIGRSHGIHAEPVSIGLKFAGFYDEFKRNRSRLKDILTENCRCAISGAVGTFANIDPFVQNYVATKLNLKEETFSTQVIPRDRHALIMSIFAITASSIERLAVEIRHSQRTEVLEMEEGFTKGQKGSSAMPHKKNPILSENLTGLARVIRSYLVPSMENVALWHERDISHSSVERYSFPDVTITLDFALHRAVSLLSNLVIKKDNVTRNLNLLGGLDSSQKLLLKLIEKGKTREEAYSLVQSLAMKSWNEGLNFSELASQDDLISKALSSKEILDVFDRGYHLSKINLIFSKIFN